MSMDENTHLEGISEAKDGGRLVIITVNNFLQDQHGHTQRFPAEVVVLLGPLSHTTRYYRKETLLQRTGSSSAPVDLCSSSIHPPLPFHRCP